MLILSYPVHVMTLADNSLTQDVLSIAAYCLSPEGDLIRSRLTVVSRVAKSIKHKRNRKSNDTTTTREDFTGTNIVQIQPACNPPSTNPIALKL